MEEFGSKTLVVFDGDRQIATMNVDDFAPIAVVDTDGDGTLEVVLETVRMHQGFVSEAVKIVSFGRGAGLSLGTFEVKSESCVTAGMVGPSQATVETTEIWCIPPCSGRPAEFRAGPPRRRACTPQEMN